MSNVRPDSKHLQKANAHDLRIYHITKVNQATILPNIHHHPDTMDEIRNALNAGKEVITHTDAVSVPGWSGAGYIITDPVTGDGAYKISGGGNGGFLVAFGITAFGLSIGALLIVGGSFWIGLALFSWEFLNAIMWVNSINAANTQEDFNKANFGQAIGGFLGLIPFSTPEAIIVQWFGIIFSWILTNTL